VVTTVGIIVMGSVVGNDIVGEVGEDWVDWYRNSSFCWVYSGQSVAVGSGDWYKTTTPAVL